jgi:hypothetical protein
VCGEDLLQRRSTVLVRQQRLHFLAENRLASLLNAFRFRFFFVKCVRACVRPTTRECRVRECVARATGRFLRRCPTNKPIRLQRNPSNSAQENVRESSEVSARRFSGAGSDCASAPATSALMTVRLRKRGAYAAAKRSP